MKIFVCSPFRADSTNTVEDNITNARAWCRVIAHKGHAPFAPHLLYPQFLDDTIEKDRTVGIDCGIEFLKSCDALWYFGQTISAGMVEEIRLAHKLGIPVLNGVLQITEV